MYIGHFFNKVSAIGILILACAQASGDPLEGMPADFVKSPPLLELNQVTPSTHFRPLNEEFLAKTKSQRDYVAWVEMQSNTTVRKVNFGGRLTSELLFLNNKLLKMVAVDTATNKRFQIQYLKDGVPVVMYAFLLGRDEYDVVQYYMNGALSCVHMVNGPNGAHNVWY